jgi:rare lipoprotein A (peptidoglycan hydrolase)
MDREKLPVDKRGSEAVKKIILTLALLFVPTLVHAEIGTTSWYSAECCRYNPAASCPTASGKSLYVLEAKGSDFAASWDFPIGTKLKVTSLKTGKSVIVTILDRGPAKRLHRKLDLSKSAFQKIADTRLGLIEVQYEKLPNQKIAR